MSPEPTGLAGVFSGMSNDAIEHELHAQLRIADDGDVTRLLSSAMHQMHRNQGDCPVSGCGVKVMAYVHTCLQNREAAPTHAMCETGKQAAQLVAKHWDRLIAVPSDSAEPSTSRNAPVSRAINNLVIKLDWPRDDIEPFVELERVHGSGAIACISEGLDRFPPSVQTLPALAVHLTEELGLLGGHKDKSKWPATEELRMAQAGAFAAMYQLRVVLSDDQIGLPSKMTPFRSAADFLVNLMEGHGKTLPDATTHGWVVRSVVTLLAERFVGEYRIRKYDATQQRAISNHITYFLADTDSYAELLHPRHLPAWAIELGRIRLMGKGSSHKQIALFDPRADMVDCVVAAFCAAMMLQVMAEKAALLSQDPSITVVRDWAVIAQEELENRSSVHVKRLLRDLGLLYYLTELDHEVPSEVVTVLHSSLNGMSPSEQALLRAGKALVDDNKAVTFAALYRHLLGLKEDPRVRGQGIAKVRQLTHLAMSADSHEEATELQVSHGHKWTRDPLTDAAYRLTADILFS